MILDEVQGRVHCGITQFASLRPKHVEEWKSGLELRPDGRTPRSTLLLEEHEGLK